jgi:uncharacterized membrane-anchored protein YjiN (DUF445 family)
MAKHPTTESAFDAVKEHSRTYAKNLWAIVNRHRPSSEEKTDSEKPSIVKPKQDHPVLLRALSTIPYLLGLLFALSFTWDFNGLNLSLFGYTFTFEGLLRILSVSGLIGFLTNWVAITMLFKPAKKRPILGQGLIPAQKNRIAFRLAQAVSDDLINPDIIKTKIHESDIIRIYRKRSTAYIKNIIDDPGFRSELKQWVVDYIEDMIGDPGIRAAIAQKIIIQIERSIKRNSLERLALKAYSFVKGQRMQHIIEDGLKDLPESIETGLERFDALLDDLPRRIEANSETIEEWVTSVLYKLINQLDVHALVEDNLRKYDEQRISEIILKATNEQLRYIQYLGGILGVIGGFVIWEPLLSTILLTVAGILILLLDKLLLRLGR